MLSFILMGIKGGIVIGFFCWLFPFLLRSEDAKWIRGAPTFLAIAIYVLGCLSRNIWIYYAIVLFLIPWKARNRADALALYPIALVSLPQMSAYLMLGSSQLTSVDKWLVFGVSILIAMQMLPKRGPRTKGYLDIAFLMLFLLEMLQARGQNFTSTIRALFTPIALAIPYYTISRNLKTLENVRLMFISFAFVGFVLSGVALVEMKSGWLIYTSLYQTLNMALGGVSLYSKARAGMLRAPTSFGDSTSLALFLVFTLLYMMAARDIFRKKRSWMMAMGMNMGGILAANSRNSLVALAIGLPLYDLYRKRYASLGAKAALLGIVYLSLQLLAQFSEFFAGLAGRSDETSGTNEYRRLLFQRGMEEVNKHPLVGMNIDYAMQQLQDLKQGEGIIDLVNGYVAYALVGGYPALVMTFALFAIPFAILYLRRRSLRYDIRLQRYAGAVFAIAGFSIVTTFFTAFGGRWATFYIMTIAIGTAILNVRPVPPDIPDMSGPTTEPHPAEAQPHLEPA